MYIVSVASTSLEVITARKAEIWNSLDEKTKSVYGEAYLEQLCANFQTMALTFPTDISPVTAVMRCALFSRHPKSRYTVGRGANSLMYLLTILPSWISDRLMMAINTTGRDALPAGLQQQSTGSLM